MMGGWETCLHSGGGVAFVCTAAGQGQAVTKVTCLVSSAFPRMPSLAQLEKWGRGQDEGLGDSGHLPRRASDQFS